MARTLAITFSLLSLLLNTAGATGAFPEFDTCPERVIRAQQEHASAERDHHGAHHDHAVVNSPSQQNTAQADSPDDDEGFCACCQGFFLSHLNGIPAAITAPVFPARNVDHSAPRQLTLEFASAPPVPPPKPYPV